MSGNYNKWDIVYPTRYPESIQCCHCGEHFTVDPKQPCTSCHCTNTITGIIAKVRPMILWIGKNRWYKSMTFGIPLSATGYYSDNLNQQIAISDCIFNVKKYERPMRAVLCQATRADGNVLNEKRKVGVINDEVIRKKIEEKLFNWIFSS